MVLDIIALGAVKIVQDSFGAYWIGQNSFWSGPNWPEFLQGWSGLARIILEIVGIGHNSLGSSWDWPDFLWKYVELVKINLGASGISQNCFGSS